MTPRRKGMSELLQLASVLVAMGHHPDADVERSCAKEVSSAVAALRRAVMRSTRRSSDRVKREAQFERSERRSLTPREREIVALLGKGATYKEISSELGITFSTAQSRVKGIYGKLGVHSKAELAQSLRGAESS